jgi:hypothetical protein
MRFFRLAVPALLVSFASLKAQDPIVLSFAHTEDTHNMQEIATVARIIAQGGGGTNLRADPVDILVDPAQKTMRFNGTPEQIQFTQWIFPLLDAANTASTAKNEFLFSGGAENVVHVYYLQTPKSLQEFQEIATSVRNISEIRRVITYNAPKAIAVRGTADQVALADWLIAELDQPDHTPAVHQYRMSGGFVRGSSDVRVFYLTHTASVKDFQQIATAMRWTFAIRQVFTYNAPRALVVRGTADQIAGADWLVNQLDTLNTSQPRPPSPVYNFVMRDSPVKEENLMVQVFFLNHAGTMQDFHDAADKVKAQTQLKQIQTCDSTRALIVEGTADQLTAVQTLTKDIQ